MVPETADGYALNVPDNLKATINLEALARDPMVGALRDHYKAAGRNQGEFDQLLETLGVLEAKGFVPKPLDFAAERTALGDNGAARQAEVETFAKSLKSRGDIDEAEFGELMSLAPTAAGVRLVEKLRKMNGTAGTVQPPAEPGAGAGDSAAQTEAKALARDPRYSSDKNFKRDADAKWLAAFKSA